MDASARTEFGQLALVNNGEAVVFYRKVCPSKPILEVDGLLVNTDYVVLNETKQSPKPPDIGNVIEKLTNLSESSVTRTPTAPSPSLSWRSCANLTKCAWC